MWLERICLCCITVSYIGGIKLVIGTQLVPDMRVFPFLLLCANPQLAIHTPRIDRITTRQKPPYTPFRNKGKTSSQTKIHMEIYLAISHFTDSRRWNLSRMSLTTDISPEIICVHNILIYLVHSSRNTDVCMHEICPQWLTIQTNPNSSYSQQFFTKTRDHRNCEELTLNAFKLAS